MALLSQRGSAPRQWGEGIFLEMLSLPGKKERSPVVGYGQALVREVDSVPGAPPTCTPVHSRQVSDSPL